MPVCDKCGQDIDHLIYTGYELYSARFFVVNGYSEYINWEALGDIAGDPEYRCPNCDKVFPSILKRAQHIFEEHPLKIGVK